MGRAEADQAVAHAHGLYGLYGLTRTGSTGSMGFTGSRAPPHCTPSTSLYSSSLKLPRHPPSLVSFRQASLDTQLTPKLLPCMGLPRCSWPAGPQRPRALKIIKPGSDFTGLDAAAAALNRMQVPHHCVFASDLLMASQKILQQVYQPKHIFTNILDRMADQEEPVDKQTSKDGQGRPIGRQAD